MGKKQKNGQYPDFSHLVAFIQCEADTAADPVYGESGLLKFSRLGYNQQSSNQSQSRPASGQFRGQYRSQGASFVSSEGRAVKPCVFCQESHRLYMCNAFKALKADQKYSFILEKHLCENCLLDNHSVDRCFRPSMCSIDGCSQKHSRFIHRCQVGNSPSESDAGNRVRSSEASSVQLTSAFMQSRTQVCVPMVEVRVNNKSDCAAMLDTCSTATFCTKRLADELGLTGVPIDYELSTLTSTGQIKQSNLIPTMYVESKSMSEFISLKNVHVINSIPTCESQVDAKKHEHLAGIDVIAASSRVDILIGQDNAEALIPLEVRRGKLDEPFAVKTVLGWSLHGNTIICSDMCGLIRAGKVSHRVVSNFIQSDSGKLDRIEDKVDALWRLDHEGFADPDRVMSCEDGQVLKFWDENVEFIDGHYKLPIPWKQGVQVPDNLKLAQSRLRSLRHSLGKRGLLERYDAEIQKLLDKGYAETVVEVVPESLDSSAKVWYLPHHGVISDKKTDKLRVVFDCAAQYRGESLNDKCRQGPDLNNKLVHVLLRFREHEYAIMADVEAMYYQVKVSEKDRDALRFL